MHIKAKDYKKQKTVFLTPSFNAGKADVDLLFVTGFFFLTMAFAIAYFSYFGLAPLSKLNKAKNMPAVASLPLLEPGQSLKAASLSKAQDEDFFATLSDVPVKEIFIGSYGMIDTKILEAVRSGTEKIFGVKTTILHPAPDIPKEEPFYDAIHNKYDSDALLKSVEQSSAPYGQSARFLYVVDLNMSSFSKESSTSTWIRADKGLNAALVSIQPFYAETGLSKILLDRAKKVSIRAIGITVGFGLSPSVTKSSCLMYPALTVKDIDAEGDMLCSPELEAVAKVFQK